MSFTLNLGFGGLCLFVPERNRQGSVVQMHVLLPPCHQQHDVFLVFDDQAPTGGAPMGRATQVPLLNAEIDLSGASQVPPLDDVPPGVVSLTDRFGAHVPRTLLVDNDTGGILNARVRFDAGTSSIVPCGAGGIWRFPPDATPVQLPIRMIWRIVVDSPENALTVRITGINGNAGSRTVRLLPHHGELDVWVFNSPSGHVPQTLPPMTSEDIPDLDEEASHFACFHHVTGTSGNPVPRFVRAPVMSPDCFPSEAADPGLDLMCIAARAEPTP